MGAMEAVVTIDEVMSFDTRGGNVRYVVRDSDGNEYTTFRESIGEAAKRLEGAGHQGRRAGRLRGQASGSGNAVTGKTC
jgi:hypothetical protein